MNYFEQESERLRFRRLTMEDVPSRAAFFVNNESLRYLGPDLNKDPGTSAKIWIKHQMKRYAENRLGILAVELKNSGELIGLGCVLARDLDGKNEIEISYSLKPKFWGRGFATEIANIMKTYCFENFQAERFISLIHIDNVVSTRVAEKIGMAVLFQTNFLGMDVDVYGIESGV